MLDGKGIAILVSRPAGLDESELSGMIARAFPNAKVKNVSGLEETLAALSGFPPQVLVMDLLGKDSALADPAMLTKGVAVCASANGALKIAQYPKNEQPKAKRAITFERVINDKKGLG
jgi:hypothetical protein